MKVSVVICSYSMDLYDNFCDAVDSILSQTYSDVELVIVIDGTRRLYERVRSEFGGRDDCLIHCNDENQGVSYSRTKGAELASGDVVAFIDDDAIAEPDWVAKLVEVYESTDALAVGGRMVGNWVAGRPSFLPVEFNWLVGVTYPGFASAGEEVRNTFESNISFRRDVFLELGGFDTDFGPTADSYSHSEGAEIGTRLQATYGRGVVYAPEAVVQHTIFEHRTQLRWLLRRAFDQGVSKRQMETIATESTNEELGYLQYLFGERVPKRILSVGSRDAVKDIVQLLMLVVLTTCVCVGYLYSILIEMCRNIQKSFGLF